MRIPNRHVALIGLLVAVPVSAWAIAYRPMNNAVRGVAEEIRTRTSSLSHYDEINTQYREMKSLNKKVTHAVNQAIELIPFRHGADQWLESASDAAFNLGLHVKSVSTSKERTEGEFRVLPVDLRVSGTFESVYSLIQHLEQINRLSRIDRMNIHRVEDDFVEARIVIHLIFTHEGDER